MVMAQGCFLYSLEDILILSHIFLKGKKLPVRLVLFKEDSFLEELCESHIWTLFVCEDCALPAHKLF